MQYLYGALNHIERSCCKSTVAIHASRLLIAVNTFLCLFNCMCVCACWRVGFVSKIPSSKLSLSLSPYFYVDLTLLEMTVDASIICYLIRIKRIDGNRDNERGRKSSCIRLNVHVHAFFIAVKFVHLGWIWSAIKKDIKRTFGQSHNGVGRKYMEKRLNHKIRNAMTFKMCILNMKSWKKVARFAPEKKSTNNFAFQLQKWPVKMCICAPNSVAIFWSPFLRSFFRFDCKRIDTTTWLRHSELERRKQIGFSVSFVAPIWPQAPKN